MLNMLIEKLLHVGGNESGRECPIWELAHRHNKESLAKNGQVTSRNPVKRKYRPLPLV